METHICIVCGKEFQARQKNKNCCSINCYYKYNYQKHKDRILTYHKKHYQLHKEEIKGYTRKYYRKNRDRKIAYSKQYTIEHKDDIRIKNHQRYIKNRSDNNFKERQYARHVKNRYKLTPDEIKEMYDKQGGLCPICLKPLGNDISIDHDHSNNKVRGLLHRGCNAIIADYETMLKEKENYLQNNLSYLGIKYFLVKAPIDQRKDYTRFLKILKMQNYECPICHKKFSWFDINSYGRRTWAIDHIHSHNSNGIVRGILCYQCNILVGRLEKIKKYGQERIENYITDGYLVSASAYNRHLHPSQCNRILLPGI